MNMVTISHLNLAKLRATDWGEAKRNQWNWFLLIAQSSYFGLFGLHMASEAKYRDNLILWLGDSMTNCFLWLFPNSRSQVPLSILLFDLILWLGWLDFMTIFHQIWGEKGKFLILNYSCLRQFQLIVLAMLSKISQTGGNLQFQLLILAHANKKQHYLGHILSLEWKIP